ncbi:hypothetical protein N9I36_00460 [Planktomarina temperata]|nr:hypothetical protein [Planktomarina temperata]
MTKARDLADFLGNNTSLGTINDAYDAGTLVPSSSNPSLIINGDMRIAQRQTSSTTSGFVLDRFFVGNQGGTRTRSQQAITSGAPYDLGFRNCLKFTNTVAGGNNTTDYLETYYKIESQDVATSGWDYTSPSSYITLSFWVRSSVAGTYTFWTRCEDANANTYGFNYTLAANTWTKVTHSIPGHSNLVFNNDNGAGLRLQWIPFYGSGHTSSSATVNAWSTGSSLPDQSTAWNTTTGATFELTGIKLEVGSEATDFQHTSYAEELTKCQRYYQNNGLTSNDVLQAFQYHPSYKGIQYSYFCPMRSPPSVTKTTGGNTLTLHAVTNQKLFAYVASGVNDVQSQYMHTISFDAEL